MVTAGGLAKAVDLALVARRRVRMTAWSQGGLQC
jgi:hypothetical protein